MSHAETISGQNGSNWLVNLPDQIQFSQANHTPNGPYFLDLNATGHGPLTIDVHIDLESLFGSEFHGILSGTFNDLDGSGQGTNTAADAGNGLRGSIVLNLHNDLGVPIGGPLAEEFGLVFLGNNDLRPDTENNPAGHPLYAHFHGVPTSADGVTIDAGSVVGSTGTPGAPDALHFEGHIPVDGTLSVAIATLHERDVAGQDDSFFMTWFPTRNITSEADFATLQARWDAQQNPTPGTSTPGTTTPDDTDTTPVDDGHDGHKHHDCSHDWMI
jgi:hypothetical protein